MFSSFILAGCGILYAWELLTPMLFEYLSSDGTKGWTFQHNGDWKHMLDSSSTCALQAQLVFKPRRYTSRHYESVWFNPQALTTYRKHIWFGAFVMGAIFSPPRSSLAFPSFITSHISLFEIALILHRIIPMRSIQADS